MHTIGTTVGHQSRVPELAGDLCAGLVDRISQPSQSRGRLGVDDDDLLLRSPLRCDGQIGDRCQADAAECRFEMKVDQLVSDETVRRASLEGGRFDRSIAKVDRSELRWLKDIVDHTVTLSGGGRCVLAA